MWQEKGLTLSGERCGKKKVSPVRERCGKKKASPCLVSDVARKRSQPGPTTLIGSQRYSYH
eukprot:360723-Chlamydomonas_euryale.AAC.2